jgi:acylphosphatase
MMENSARPADNATDAAHPKEAVQPEKRAMTGNGATDFGASESGDPGSGRKERREVYYAGHVQGVGFRYTTRSIASQLPVVGRVRNLPDGRVHLVAEGAPEAIDELLARVEAELGRYIRGREAMVRPATGEFSTFEVAR